MTLVNNSGTVLTQSALEALTTTVTQPVVRKFTENVYELFTPPGVKDFEKYKRLKYRAGQEVPQAEIDAHYGDATDAVIDTVLPATGPAVGGTTIVLTGKGFDGATAITVGGVACTEFKRLSNTSVSGKTGAHAAGAVNVVLTDASGNVTKTNAFTYV